MPDLIRHPEKDSCLCWDDKMEDVGVFPKDWDMKQCYWGNICTLKYGKALRNYSDQPSEAKNIRVFGTNGPIGWTKEPLCSDAGIIIGRKGAYRGVHFSPEPFFVIDTAYYLLLQTEEIDLKWAYYKLLTVDINRMDVGAAIPTTNRDEFHGLPLAYPKKSKQQRVVDVLSAYDDLIENNRRRMALLEESARLLYQEWFVRLRFPGYEHTRIVDGVPEGWERQRIANIAECIGGGTPPTSVSSYWEDGDIPWITPTDVTHNKYLVLLDCEKKITEKGLQKSSAKLVPPHAVLMTSRASVGYFAVFGREVSTNQGFISIVPREKKLSHYLLFHLLHRVDEIRSMGSGSTYPEVSRSKFREFEVTVPGRRMISLFAEQIDLLLKQIRSLKQQSQKLRQARDILLPLLINGEITV
jgi:type I restriction enzyme S subunit